ncbi:hypothetical protein D3C72_2267750 [compost metagenome]
MASQKVCIKRLKVTGFDSQDREFVRQRLSVDVVVHAFIKGQHFIPHFGINHALGFFSG